MKEQLIKLANEKGFLSKLSIILSGIDYMPKTIEKYIKDIEYYLWMCELQKWLMDAHKIHVSINHYTMHKLLFSLDVNLVSNIRIIHKYDNDRFEIYEQALEKGLFEALKLLK